MSKKDVIRIIRAESKECLKKEQQKILDDCDEKKIDRQFVGSSSKSWFNGGFEKGAIYALNNKKRLTNIMIIKEMKK